MEITQEELDAIKERQYLSGQRILLISQLSDIIRRLGYDESLSKSYFISEREQAIIILRRMCEEHGDNNWPDDLHLADILEKYLEKYLK